jgi:hypothetical protein
MSRASLDWVSLGCFAGTSTRGRRGGETLRNSGVKTSDSAEATEPGFDNVATNCLDDSGNVERQSDCNRENRSEDASRSRSTAGNAGLSISGENG